MRAEAVRDLTTAFKSNMAKRKKDPKHHFKLRFRTRKVVRRAAKGGAPRLNSRPRRVPSLQGRWLAGCLLSRTWLFRIGVLSQRLRGFTKMIITAERDGLAQF